MGVLCECRDKTRQTYTYLIIKAAATFRTLGHLTKANIVSKFPNIPINIIRMVATAANVSKDRENL